MLGSLGIVVIGRNEGPRLKTCIRSLPSDVPVVYVDSGSSDGSPAWAAEYGCAVVSLSTDKPFSAARARNEGLERLTTDHRDIDFVQFIDGDCELDAGWLAVGLARLADDEGLAAVAGLRRERFVEKSWYNELCAYEWDTPVGEAAAIGGDAIYRIKAFDAVGGFDPLMMAGEEPELCLRLRRAGHRIERLDADMTLHDAAIYHFGAWWKRAVRSGYAYTLGAMKHGRSGYNVREVARALLWGVTLPAFVVVMFSVGQPWLAAMVVALYPIKWFRVCRGVAAHIRKPGRYALFLMITNVAEVRGVVRACLETMGNRRQIVEYKN
ncbi:MAG: glycosyltransferase [Pseudomonadota bacterium]